MSTDRFHPAVRRWFAERLGEPTPAQRRGWPRIREGLHVLIAAPTGSGKTLAAFLAALDDLLRRGAALADQTQVLYVSPLKALSNDVQKNLQAPLAEIRALDPSLPEVRVLVRTGDTGAAERAAMIRRPPHVLVTTPESLYILLTSERGRAMLATVRTVIVDEIHALVRDKRGAHLALSLERLEALAGPFQRIGLSATQKPLETTARFLVGTGREVSTIDAGHLRDLDLAIEVPPSPLSAVCSHEVWDEVYSRLAELVRAHRTTLVFVNTRKMAERIAMRLGPLLGEEAVTCHHGSLSRATRLDAEQRLKQGKLRALVATASLELGIDIGEVDLAVQIGSCRSIATFLQRMGRAGHGIGRVPKGRVFPLTRDELVEAAAVVSAVRRGELDRTVAVGPALDILAQQVVAECACRAWDEAELFARLCRAWPYRDLTREEFDAAAALHTQGRAALLHRDGVNGRLMGTRRARLAAITCGGAIPDTADYAVVLEPEGTRVGTLNEDFCVESNVGDVFQLGNTSWRILKIEPGTVRVVDARGAPPMLPFWLGEAPARTVELSAEVGKMREDPRRAEGIGEVAAGELGDYLEAGRKALGAAPSQDCVVLERFFDESGGMQLVVHAPFGGRVNRAWGLALRKRFCRGFGFELQAAANEDAILLSLGPQHSFPLEEVFDFLHPNSAREVLVQAVLATPLFGTRWRWNVTRALVVERMRSGKRVPAALVRMRAQDALARAFPEVLACGENLPPGDRRVPIEHPLVRQTVSDCLNEAMDVEGFLAVLRRLRHGTIRRVAVDTTEPSPFAQGILAAHPYSFLDDAPLEERRTQAVISRRGLDAETADHLGALDPEAIRRVREEAWPDPRDAEEVHEALLWMGYATVAEATPWRAWMDVLAAAGRVVREGDLWFAAEASRDPKTVLRGRLEAIGPVFEENPLLRELEREGAVLRTRFEGAVGWCDRRLLARIHRYTLDQLRREIEPATAADFVRFLACWQYVEPEHRLEGPRGVAQVLRRLAGFEAPAAAWEGSLLPSRVRAYRREWLDHLTMTGEVAWGRLWGGGASAVRVTPICLVPREDLDAWLGLAGKGEEALLSGAAQEVRAALETRGAMFPLELAKAAKLLPAHLEMALAELIARGLATSDSFVSLRQLVVPLSRRRVPVAAAGRWSLFRRGEPAAPLPDFVARRLLDRTGVLFRRLLAREKQPVPWRDLVRALRRMEARGEVRGGRFVSGFEGEQYALPEAVEQLRQVRRRPPTSAIEVSAADPLNLKGILTPEERVSSTSRGRVKVTAGAEG